MQKHRAYFEKHFSKEILNEEERNEATGLEDSLFDAMKLFSEHEMRMFPNFDEANIVYKDLSHPDFSLDNPNFFNIENNNPKLMPRKARFYLREGHIEFVYENREFDALNGETHEYSGPEYVSWYSNDEIEEHLTVDSLAFRENSRHFLASLFKKLNYEIITEMNGLLDLSEKIIENKIINDGQVAYSGEFIYDFFIEVVNNLDYEVSPIFRNPAFVRKLEETKDDFAPLISVINSALLYLVQVHNRLLSNLEHDINIIKTGREGEIKVIKEVERAPYFTGRSGYTIAYGEESFESDIIVINHTGVHLIEVKNYGSMSRHHQSFKIHQDGEMTFYINGKETKARRSPVKQVKRHQAIMEQILQDHGYDVPVKACVVMANDYLSFVNNSDVPVLSLYQLENYLREGDIVLGVENALAIGQIIDNYKRSEKKFPVFNYRKVFDEIFEEIVFTTSQFIQNEMYENFNIEDFMAVTVFADYVLSSMLLEQSVEQREQFIEDVRTKEVLQPLDEIVEQMDLFEKIGLFTVPGVLNFEKNRMKRFIFLGATSFTFFGFMSSFFKRYPFQRMAKGPILGFLHLFKLSISYFIVMNSILVLVFIYLSLSNEKVQEDIFTLSQHKYSFWKGNLTEKIAAFLRIPHYFTDERGNFDYERTVRLNKFHKISIAFLILAFQDALFSLPVMPFIYFALFIKNSLRLIRKS